MSLKPSIELVIDKRTARLTNCFAIDGHGSRVAELPIAEAREQYKPGGPGIVSIDLHAFRVKRTEESA